MSTRPEARMIAEELYKLLEKGNVAKDAWLTKQEAAAAYKVPVSHFDHYGKNYVRRQFGVGYKYSNNFLKKKFFS